MGGVEAAGVGSSMRVTIVRRASECILYDADVAPGICSKHFDSSWWRKEGAVVGGAQGRAQVVFVRPGNDQGVWALRHYHRGGWVARISRDRYVWCGAERSRPWQEWRLLAQLHSIGLPVARPVAARAVRTGPFYRGDFITRRIESAEPLAGVLHGRALDRAEWMRIGRMLRRFHDAGVRHDDINVHNILRDASGGFHLIDFDKARIIKPGAWQRQNLQRLRRSLEKVRGQSADLRFTESDWTALGEGYHGAPAEKPRAGVCP